MSDWKLTYRGVEVPEDLYEADPDPYEEALGIWQRAVDAALGAPAEATDPEVEGSEFDYYATTDHNFVWRVRQGGISSQIIDHYDEEWEDSSSDRYDLERVVVQDPKRYEKISVSQLPSWARED